MIRGKILSIPGFPYINYLRRRALESQFFDFNVRPLAEKLGEWPAGLTIDTTNRCNAKCLWCPHPVMKHDFIEMDWDLFTRVIDDYATKGGVIRFGNFGEPLMDKRFIERIRYIRNKEKIFYVDMNTNLFFLDRDKAKELVDLKINFHVSLDELDKDLYEKVKEVDFERVKENLLNLAEVNIKSRNSIRIDIKLKTIQMLKELKKTPFFKELEILQSEGTVSMDLLPIAKSDCINNMGGNFNPNVFFDQYIKNVSLNRSFKKFNLQNQAPCSAFWRNMVIMPDGGVVQCCVDIKKEVIIGDLKIQTVEEIWRGEPLATLRNKAIERKRNEMILCPGCDLHQGWRYLKTYFSLEGQFYKEPHRA